MSVPRAALQKTLWGLGYQLLVGSHEYEPAREADVLLAIVERGVDGIVLVETDHADAVHELLRQYGLPYVFSWAQDEARPEQCVGFSYHAAAHRLARAVLDHGHTRIALCPGIAAGNERVRARINGTRAALESAGIALRGEWIVQQPFTFEGGRRAVAVLWKAQDRPTALICGTDIQAIGAIGECHDLGLRVPDDLSITGSDDIEMASLVSPRLTTVHVPTSEVGKQSALRIVDLIEGRVPRAAPDLQTTLVVRVSLKHLASAAAQACAGQRT